MKIKNNTKSVQKKCNSGNSRAGPKPHQYVPGCEIDELPHLRGEHTHFNPETLFIWNNIGRQIVPLHHVD